MAQTALVFAVLSWLAARVQSQGLGECQFDDNGYHLRWKVDDQDNVHFDFQFDNFPSDNRWTAIAFGESMKSGLDVIMIKSFNGGVMINDQSALGYAPSIPDRVNNVQVVSAQLDQGTLKAVFSRALATGDSDNDHDIHGCTTWQFATSANILDGLGNIRQHTTKPVTQRVCVEQCRGEAAAGFGRPPPRGMPGIAEGGGQSGGNPNAFAGGLPIALLPSPSPSIGCSRPDGDWCVEYINNFSQWSEMHDRKGDVCASLQSVIPMCCKAYHDRCT